MPSIGHFFNNAVRKIGNKQSFQNSRPDQTRMAVSELDK